MDKPLLSQLVQAVQWTVLWEQVEKSEDWFYSPSLHAAGIKQEIGLINRFDNLKHLKLYGAGNFENPTLLDAEDLQQTDEFPWPTSHQLEKLAIAPFTSIEFESNRYLHTSDWEFVANLIWRCPSVKTFNLRYLDSFETIQYPKDLLSCTTLRSLFVKLSTSFDLQLAVLLNDCKHLRHLTLNTNYLSLDQIVLLEGSIRQLTSLDINPLCINGTTLAIHSIIPSIQSLKLNLELYPDKNNRNSLRIVLTSLFPPQYPLEYLTHLRLSFPMQYHDLDGQQSNLLDDLQPLLSRVALPRLEFCSVRLNFSRVYDMEISLGILPNESIGMEDRAKTVFDAVIEQFRLLAREVPPGLWFQATFGRHSLLTLKRLVTRGGGEVLIERW